MKKETCDCGMTEDYRMLRMIILGGLGAIVLASAGTATCNRIENDKYLKRLQITATRPCEIQYETIKVPKIVTIAD